MAATVAMAIAGDVTRASRLGPLWLVAIGLVTVVKARYVLGDYLGLRGNRAALAGLTGAVALTLVAVIGAFLAIGP